MTTTSPRDPPTSFRLGRGRETRFREFQAREKLSQSDALHRLIDHGLSAEGFPDPKTAPKVAPTKDPHVKKRWSIFCQQG